MREINLKIQMRWKMIQHQHTINQRNYSWISMVEREAFNRWSIENIEIKARILKIILGRILQCQVRRRWIETKLSTEQIMLNQGICQKIKLLSINLSRIQILIYESETMIFQRVIAKNLFQKLISFEWIKIVRQICLIRNHKQRQ